MIAYSYEDEIRNLEREVRASTRALRLTVFQLIFALIVGTAVFIVPRPYNLIAEAAVIANMVVIIIRANKLRSK